jgi:hypothetical protein
MGFVNSQEIPFLAPHALRNTVKLRKETDTLKFSTPWTYGRKLDNRRGFWKTGQSNYGTEG